MKHNYKKIRQEVCETVKEAAYSPDNKFSSTVWAYHILPVVEHSLRLGRELKADLEVLELASLLHDYAALVNYKYYKKHHIYGARLAGDILNNLGYPKDKIKQIQECIFCHRGSVPMNKKTIEAKILASADAMAHITEMPDIFFLAFHVHGLETYEGCQWIKGKINRSWKKIMPEGKEIIQEDYDLFMCLINRSLKKGSKNSKI